MPKYVFFSFCGRVDEVNQLISFNSTNFNITFRLSTGNKSMNLP